jgi:ribonuclease-3
MAAGDSVDPHVPWHFVTVGDAETLLGHKFARPELLAEALTHRSAVSGAGSNERLEFMGDRVLGLIVAEWLLEKFPDEPEGEINQRYSALVSRPALAAVAQAAGLPALLKLSRTEAKRGVAGNPTVLADAFEAAIGALYLDAGLEVARGFVRRMLADRMLAAPPKDSKTALQEWALARAMALPEYIVEDTSGPSHAPQFTIAVRVGEVSARGVAGSKRAAEQAAAKLLLDSLS